MADEYKKTALDDYFSSMLSMPKTANTHDEPEVIAETAAVESEFNETAFVEGENLQVEPLENDCIDTEPAETELTDTEVVEAESGDADSSPDMYLEPELPRAELHLTSKDYDDSQVTFALPDEPLTNNLQDLDQLLDSVVDIELADIDLSELETNLEFSQEAQLETDLALAALSDSAFEEPTIEAQMNVLQNDNVDIDALSVGADMMTPDSSIADAAVEEVQVEEAAAAEPEPEPEPEWKNVELDNEFQALFFEVAGVTFAVPLTELGGIYQTDNINALFGKPDWFLGIMQHREQKYSVVDTVNWVMPEQEMGKIDYKYQIQLSESNWVLGSETLLGNETLKHSDIKWRTTPGTRPWLAGMVKSRMCVLLHVTEMIKLLESGINIHGQ